VGMAIRRMRHAVASLALTEFVVAFRFRIYLETEIVHALRSDVKIWKITDKRALEKPKAGEN
jgi:hypothetical protein